MSDDQIQPEPRPTGPKSDDDLTEAPRPRRRPRLRDVEEDEDDPDRFRNPDALESLIPYKNPRALIAYYVGVFSLIPCFGLILGPVAIVLGVLGLKYRTAHPTAGGAGHAITGIVLGTVVLLGHLTVAALIAGASLGKW